MSMVSQHDITQKGDTWHVYASMENVQHITTGVPFVGALLRAPSRVGALMRASVTYTHLHNDVKDTGCQTSVGLHGSGGTIAIADQVKHSYAPFSTPSATIRCSNLQRGTWRSSDKQQSTRS